MATVDDLRDALRDERARVADLRKRVQDIKYLRFCLVSATGVLDIVEHAISPATMVPATDRVRPRGESRLRRFSHGKVKRRRAHRELLARRGISFHIRAYQISHASKSKLNTHPDIKNTGIHLADKNPLGMF
jgi:hypothetical protein